MAGKIARDGAEKIGGGHDSIEVSVLIMHHRHADARLLEHPQRIQRIKLIGDHLALADQIGQVNSRSGQQQRQHFARLDHAHHLVHRAIRHRQQRMRAGGDGGAQFFFGFGQIDPVDLRAGRHQFAHRAFAQPHDAGKNRPLLFLDHAAGGGIGEDHLNLLRRNMMVALVADPQQPQQHVRRIVEQPNHRRSHPREQRHRARHHQCNRHSSAQGDLLGHQFAHH